ncbi:PML-RARA-regulated adapter molecule 1 isoform X2 [Pseudorca crassidens]|uniref:PML-RARA-regulated adapter molecule 1 isoform X2 n=1 Tax=Pseudorca crassidens TaxID=82174 RepID=UPI00352D27FC
MGSHQDFRSLQAKFQASQPETGKLPQVSPKPEFNKLLKKFPQPELGEHPKKHPQPEFTDLPKKPCKLEFSELSKKVPQLKATPFPRKPLQPELSHAPRPPTGPKFGAFPRKSQQPESNEATLKPPQPKFSTVPEKSQQPESNEATLKPPQPKFSTVPEKPPQLGVSGLPEKSLPQPESTEVPPMPPSKPESSEPQPHSSQPNFSTVPGKMPQPPLSDLPEKPPRPECGDLPRTSSGPECSLLPKEFLQPEWRGPPCKSSQPKPRSLPRKHAEFFGDLPRKPPLPGSRSESSLPTAVAGSSPRFPLSPGFGARQQRSGALTCGGGSRLGLKPGHPPRRRPLPPVSSLGAPPAKPPLPPGPRDVQRFRRTLAAGTALPRSFSAGFLARQPEDTPQDPDEAYKLYEDVEPTDDSRPSPKGRDEVLSTQQPPRRPPQDQEPRKEKGPQPQQLLPTDLKSLKQIRKAEKAEREFRKKFKFEGEIVIQTRMMIDPNAKTRRGGGKHLALRRGEILEVIEFTSKEEMLCRDTKGKYGYVPRTALLPLETEVYDDVGSWDPLDNQPFPGGR